MYDATNEANEFVGDDRAGAVAKACTFFDKDEADLKVLVPPVGQIYGVGARVVIVAVPRSASPPRNRGGSDSGDREERPRGRGREGGRERGGRDRGRDRGPSEARAPRDDADNRGNRDDRGNRAEPSKRSESADREKPAAAPRRTASADGSKGTAKGKMGTVGDFILGVVERMDLGDFEIAEVTENDFLIYQLSGAGAAELAAEDGRALDALRLLANQAAMRGNDDAPRVVVDVEGAGERREEALERLASRAAKRAQDGGRSIALDAMNGHDRRLIHMAIREMDGVVTMSIGEGRYRQVLVVPEGAEEYDEALEASRDADAG